MGKKKFIDKKKSATFELCPRDSSDPRYCDAPGGDKVFLRVDQNPVNISGFIEDEEEGDTSFDDAPKELTFESSDFDDSSNNPLPADVRKEILELGYPDDGYNLQWIQSAEAQGHATLFVAKFFGRAGLMSFISAVPESQCPDLFQSLLYEACGRTVNPINGAVGLLWTGNWNTCQAAVDTVLRGGCLRPIPELLTRGGGFGGFSSPSPDEASEICTEMLNLREDDYGERGIYHHCRFSNSRSRSMASPPKRKRLASQQQQQQKQSSEVDLSIIPYFPIKMAPFKKDRHRSVTPSMYSEESVTTVSFRDNNAGDRYLRGGGGGETAKLLNLFA